MLAADGAAIGRSSKNVFMMDVSLRRTCGTPVSRRHEPTPRSRLMKVIHMQTANCANAAVKDKCISWNICHTEALHHSSESICLLNYQPSHCIHGSIQYLFEAVDTNRNSLFGVKVSIKDGCALKNDDNRMPTLCVLLVILKSKNGLLSRQYEHRWISLLGSQHVCVLA